MKKMYVSLSFSFLSIFQMVVAISFHGKATMFSWKIVRQMNITKGSA